MGNKKITLESGATLEIGEIPFGPAKALYQAIASEARTVNASPNPLNLLKDIICTALESKKVEMALAPCLGRCLYNGLKVSDELFEPVENRRDYLPMCLAVVEETVQPFMKDLYAQFGVQVEKVKSLLA